MFDHFRLKESDYGRRPKKDLTGVNQDPSIDAWIHWLLFEAPLNGELNKTGMRECEIQDEELSQRFHSRFSITKTSAQSQLTCRSETDEAEDAEDEDWVWHCAGSAWLEMGYCGCAVFVHKFVVYWTHESQNGVSTI